MSFIALLLFFVVYHLYGIIAASCVLSVTSALLAVIFYIRHKKISYTDVLVAVVSILTLSISLITKDVGFIKMKPTIVYSIFGSSLVLSRMMGFNLLKSLLQQHQITLSDVLWKRLGTRMGLFFFTVALLNEAIRRYYSEVTWIHFKTFGIMGLHLLFFVSQFGIFKQAQFPSKPSKRSVLHHKP